MVSSVNFYSVFGVEQLLYTGQGINWEAQGICIQTSFICSFIHSFTQISTENVLGTWHSEKHEGCNNVQKVRSLVHYHRAQ